MDKLVHDVAGFTEEGYPIVTHTYHCPLWTAHSAVGLCPTRECWYCAYSDFRKTTSVMLERSVCRHPGNRVHAGQTGPNQSKPA
ncbi:MAG: hypothetical protein RRY97_09890 [Oscillibacter sp.]